MKIKIILIVVCVTLAAILATSMILYNMMSGILIDQSVRNDSLRVNQACHEISSTFEEARTQARSIAYNSEAQAYLNKYEQLDYNETVSMQFSINKTFSQIIAVSEHIASIALIGDANHIVWTEMPYYDQVTLQDKKRWYTALDEALTATGNDGTRMGLTGIYPFTDCSGKKMEFITLVIPCMSMQQLNRQLGLIAINLNCTQLQTVLKKYNEDLNFETLVLCVNGVPTIYSDELPQDGKTAQLIQEEERLGAFQNVTTDVRLNHDPDLYTMVYPVTDHCTLLSVRNFSHILHLIRPSLLRMLILLVGASIFIVCTLACSMTHITKPTRQLEAAMERVSQGNLDVRVSIHTHDEFEKIGNGFNQMTSQLNEYLQRSMQEENTRHKLEYELLLSQIKPHFIYNTLNTVIYLGEQHGDKEVVDIVHSLIRLLQDSIQKDGQPLFTTVSKDIGLIRDYVNIQNYRYKDMFSLHTEVEADTDDCMIPRAVLQPLVENALYHGISSLGCPGNITIRVKKAEEEGKPVLVMQIEDDGIGIPSETLESILHARPITDATGRQHIGIVNIQKRLDLLFPNQHSFTIRSKVEEGTQITIRLRGIEI